MIYLSISTGEATSSKVLGLIGPSVIFWPFKIESPSLILSLAPIGIGYSLDSKEFETTTTDFSPYLELSLISDTLPAISEMIASPFGGRVSNNS